MYLHGTAPWPRRRCSGSRSSATRRLGTEKRCYPGGAFDPLGFASNDEDQTNRLKEAKIEHGRLATVAFGYGTQGLLGFDTLGTRWEPLRRLEGLSGGGRRGTPRCASGSVSKRTEGS